MLWLIGTRFRIDSNNWSFVQKDVGPVFFMATGGEKCDMSRPALKHWEDLQEVYAGSSDLHVATLDCSVEVEICRSHDITTHPWFGALLGNHFMEIRVLERNVETFRKTALRVLQKARQWSEIWSKLLVGRKFLFLVRGDIGTARDVIGSGCADLGLTAGRDFFVFGEDTVRREGRMEAYVEGEMVDFAVQTLSNHNVFNFVRRFVPRGWQQASSWTVLVLDEQGEGLVDAVSGVLGSYGLRIPILPVYRSGLAVNGLARLFGVSPDADEAVVFVDSGGLSYQIIEPANRSAIEAFVNGTLAEGRRFVTVVPGERRIPDTYRQWFYAH